MDVERILGRWSPSKIDCANKCAAQFRYRYVQRLPEATTSSLAFGRALDETGNAVYIEKQRTGKTPSVDDARARWAAEWDYYGDAVVEWDDDESKGSCLDEGVRGVPLWRNGFAAHLQPEAVQEKLVKTVVDEASGDSFEVSGVLDVRGVIAAAARKVVADLKSSGKRYGVDRVIRGTQPVAYTLLTGIPTFEFHVLVRTKTPKTQLFRAAITDDDRRAFVKRTAILRRNVAHALTSGDWLPNRAHQMCSRRWCSFWAQCERDHGGCVAP